VDVPLGPLLAGDFKVRRSGLRWLVPDLHHCRAGEVVAFCNVGLTPRLGARPARVPFGEEWRDLQVTLAPSAAGILHQRAGVSLGGDLDQLHFYQDWLEAEAVAALEIEPNGNQASPAWQLGFAAGRRMTELAEDRSGLLTGWHNRSRAWHGEVPRHATLLSLGICEQNGIFRGEANAFLDILQDSPGRLHVVHMPDESLVPCSAVLLDQLERNSADNSAIATDMALGILGSGFTPDPADWVFAGCALGALTRSPLLEQYDLLTRQGLASTASIQAVVLSVHAEPATLLRHRKLGYIAFWHRFRVRSAGPAVREWLETSFEKMTRSLADIQRDLLALRQALAARGVKHMLILNAMSSSGHEDIVSYAAFPGSLGETLSTVRAKEINLMLHDLAETSDIAIVDVDAIAAELGGAGNLPDGVHQSRRMQSELRAEILHILAQRGLFSPVPS
jgi:hypothetical protein